MSVSLVDSIVALARCAGEPVRFEQRGAMLTQHMRLHKEVFLDGFVILCLCCCTVFLLRVWIPSPYNRKNLQALRITSWPFWHVVCSCWCAQSFVGYLGLQLCDNRRSLAIRLLMVFSLQLLVCTLSCGGILRFQVRASLFAECLCLVSLKFARCLSSECLS
jgi:hypothetical protein